MGVRPTESCACTSAPRSMSMRAESIEPTLTAAHRGVETTSPIPGGVRSAPIVTGALTFAPLSRRYFVICGDCITEITEGFVLLSDQNGMGTPHALSAFTPETRLLCIRPPVSILKTCRPVTNKIRAQVGT